MCFRKKIKEGNFNKVRDNRSKFTSSITYSKDCDYVQPVSKWYCYNPFKKSNSEINSQNLSTKLI